MLKRVAVLLVYVSLVCADSTFSTAIEAFRVGSDEKGVREVHLVNKLGNTTCAFSYSTRARGSADAEVKTEPPKGDLAAAKAAVKKIMDMQQGKCLSSGNVQGYQYEVCLDGSITQTGNGENNLVGKYARMAENGLTLAFENGASCADTGTPRRGTVDFICKPQLVVVSVGEAVKCVYTVIVGSPDACNNPLFDKQPVYGLQETTKKKDDKSQRWTIEIVSDSKGNTMCTAMNSALEHALGTVPLMTFAEFSMELRSEGLAQDGPILVRRHDRSALSTDEVAVERRRDVIRAASTDRFKGQLSLVRCG